MCSIRSGCGLGHLSGLPLLAGVLALIFIVEAWSRRASPLFFWAAIITVRDIVGHERGDLHTFRDDTGDISAEIEDEIRRGQKVEPTTNVQVFGELDRGARGRYISVGRITVLE